MTKIFMGRADNLLIDSELSTHRLLITHDEYGSLTTKIITKRYLQKDGPAD